MYLPLQIREVVVVAFPTLRSIYQTAKDAKSA